MASSSSSSRRKEKVARVTRNANPYGWISGEGIRGKFLFWRVIKSVVPHKYLNLQLFKKEGFLFKEWIAYQGLTNFVQMKEDCYPDLIEVFYTNLRVVNGVIHSRVKGVNIIIDDNVWSNIARLKAKGLDSHIRDSESNRWLTKRAIYINCLRYPRRYKVDKQYLHDGLNKEEKLTAYGRFVEDRMSTEDVFLLNANKIRIPTNWVAVLKDHMIAADELIVGSTPTPAADHTTFIPQTDFEKYVIDQFRKKSERDERVEDTLFIWEKKGNKNVIGFETEDFDDESTDED
ncbi:hypothetical protein LR48_Vigan02g094700 [Vigna angularis]|uniref:Uncharacterized protein n=1 Tax=Phaseolus angularis TaxID=3914 RepID=A0A0L9TWJ9_PHAAN|nr:hypothetical protein LR48_Vigan02g094700 [Vigna angularis]